MKNNFTTGSLLPFLPLSPDLFPLNPSAVFGRRALLEAEIGFGTGEYITRLAQEAPHKDFIGFEQCAERILKTLRKVESAHATNVRVMRLDAVWALRYLFPPRSLAKVHCLFPCPWPKKRHAKHRLFSAAVLRLVNSRLADGASLYIVTDHAPYAAWIRENLPGTGFRAEAGIIPARFNTKFERKWAEAGQQEFYELDLVKTEHQTVDEGGCEMRTYFFRDADPAAVRLEDIWGPVTVKFGQVFYDPIHQKAMVDAVVSEQGRSQHLWVMIAHTLKGWCVSPAPGMLVLPTEGIQAAMARVAEAVERTGSK